MKPEEKFMKRAIELAKVSASNGDYAVAALIVKDGATLAEGTTMLKS